MPARDTDSCWVVATLPVPAAAASVIWNSRWAGTTDPFSTASTDMVVDPTVPVRGDDVTDRVAPSTAPVAGRSSGLATVVTVVVGWGALVVVVVVDEPEHPAALARATDRSRRT